MRFEFQMPKGSDGKQVKDDPDLVPTHVSMNGREYRTDADRCIEAPARFEGDLKLHGFFRRVPNRITVADAPPVVEDDDEKETLPKTPEKPAGGARARSE